MEETDDNVITLPEERKQEILDSWKKNPKRMPRIAKVAVNVGVGTSGVKLERAMTILESLTGQKPVKRTAKQTIRGFGIRRYEPITTMVTLRGEKAEAFLKKVLPVVDNSILYSSFDQFGNFSFGIKEHIEIPGTVYDPNLGIIGMDVTVAFEREGYRIKRRSYRRKKLPSRQKLNKDETMLFMQQKFGISFIKERIISYY
ncbi:MAG: 50S ribosomal protein L5 [Candidatus Helarchaeales archaeon]